MIGHQESFNDSGYTICSCGSHSYYTEFDSKFDSWIWQWGGLLGFIVRKPQLVWYNLVGRHFSICSECGWFDRAFGKYVGKHRDCVPF